MAKASKHHREPRMFFRPGNSDRFYSTLVALAARKPRFQDRFKLHRIQVTPRSFRSKIGPANNSSHTQGKPVCHHSVPSESPLDSPPSRAEHLTHARIHPNPATNGNECPNRSSSKSNISTRTRHYPLKSEKNPFFISTFLFDLRNSKYDNNALQDSFGFCTFFWSAAPVVSVIWSRKTSRAQRASTLRMAFLSAHIPDLLFRYQISTRKN